MRKLDEGQHDALVLAAAGLRRLGFASRIALALPAEACVPAPGQGIVAIEIRAGDDRVRSAVAAIDDRDAAVALTAERAVIEALGGGCQTPVGALATLGAADTLEIAAIVVALDGSEAVHGRVAGPRADGGRARPAPGRPVTRRTAPGRFSRRRDEPLAQWATTTVIVRTPNDG